MKSFSKIFVAVLASGLMAVSFSTDALADKSDHEHERARQAFASGKVLSLKDVLAKIENDYTGEVIEIEFETDKYDNFIYEIKLLQNDGALVKLKVDATNAEVLKEKTRNKSYKR